MFNGSVTGKIGKIGKSFDEKTWLVWIETRDWKVGVGEVKEWFGVVVSAEEYERRKAILGEGKYIGATLYKVEAQLDMPQGAVDQTAVIIGYASRLWIL